MWLFPWQALSHQKRILHETLICVFGVWRFYRFVFEERSNLSSFGFILLGWIMMFLYIKFHSLLL
jgi:hypothetical protein